MNRNDFQSLARIRLDEAKILLDSGMYNGAYYLCGYVVECALKACIAKNTNQYDFPPKPNAAKQIYSHNLKELLGAAGLQVQFDADSKTDKDLGINWNIVSPWNAESRYRKLSEKRARALYDAITDPTHGVLQWIAKYW
jgi:HEPN domain-containing protein